MTRARARAVRTERVPASELKRGRFILLPNDGGRLPVVAVFQDEDDVLIRVGQLQRPGTTHNTDGGHGLIPCKPDTYFLCEAVS